MYARCFTFIEILLTLETSGYSSVQLLTEVTRQDMEVGVSSGRNITLPCAEETNVKCQLLD